MNNLLIILLFLCFLPCTASEIETIKIDTKINLEIKVATAKDSIFPEKCLGVWEEIMHVYSQGLQRDSVKVRFTAAKTDTSGTYIWKTEYLSKTTPMVKDYKLVIDNAKEGSYILDEGEGSIWASKEAKSLLPKFNSYYIGKYLIKINNYVLHRKCEFGTHKVNTQINFYKYYHFIYLLTKIKTKNSN